MTELLTLEPREASAEEIELAPDAEAAAGSLQDRSMCTGCCIDASWKDLATRSATG